jgi:hydroxypyruvate reductase
MLGLLESADDRTLVIALISGGGSALLEDSVLPLTDIITATNWLSSRGADILQLNAVRIAMSNLKGGGLPRSMSAGTLIGLIVSDVPNDDYRFVSSGPTCEFGGEVYSQAKSVLSDFDAAPESGFPAAAIAHIENGSAPKKIQANVFNFLIGDAGVARDAAISKAIELGYEILPDVLVDTSTCEQIANAVSNWFSESSPTRQCVISLGEPIVETGESAGQGGRNQHAVLTAIGKFIGDVPPREFCFMSAGTDGEDGNTSVAGAIVTDHDLAKLSDQSAQVSDSLKRFDSHPFLAEHGLVFDSGPTGTNVADLRILLRA